MTRSAVAATAVVARTGGARAGGAIAADRLVDVDRAARGRRRPGWRGSLVLVGADEPHARRRSGGAAGARPGAAAAGSRPPSVAAPGGRSSRTTGAGARRADARAASRLRAASTWKPSGLPVPERPRERDRRLAREAQLALDPERRLDPDLRFADAHRAREGRVGRVQPLARPATRGASASSRRASSAGWAAPAYALSPGRRRVDRPSASRGRRSRPRRSRTGRNCPAARGRSVTSAASTFLPARTRPRAPGRPAAPAPTASPARRGRPSTGAPIASW